MVEILSCVLGHELVKLDKIMLLFLSVCSESSFD